MIASRTTIPEGLRRLDKWILWRLEEKKGKLDKVPLDPRTLRPGSAHDEENQLPFEEATAIAQDNDLGVGFVPTGTPYVAIDLDDCLDEDGRFNNENGVAARFWVWDLQSYTEITPSRRGLRVWVEAEVPGERKRTGPVEIYGEGQFLTVTGEVFEGLDTIEERDAELRRLYAWAFGNDDAQEKKAKEPRPVDLPDNELLDRARKAENGDQFVALYDEGDLSSVAGDRSAADFALACRLAFWTGWDPERMDRLFRASKLYRDKWDERRGRETYGARTIRRAIEETPEAYSLPVAQEEKRERRIRVLSLGELALDESLLKTPESVAPWIAWRGLVTLLSGREKDGKSTLAASIARDATKEGRRVLWLSMEEGLNRIVSRFVDLDADRTLLMIPDLHPLNWEEAEEVFEIARPDLVVVDTLTSWVGAVEKKIPDHSDKEKWQRVVLRFRRWAERRAGVLINAHANRSDGTYHGSVGIGAAVDAIAELDKVKGSDAATVRRISIVGRWTFPSVTVRFAGDTAGYVLADDLQDPKVKAGDLVVKVREYVRENGPVSKAKLEKEVPGRAEEIRAALERLIAADEIQDRGTATRSQLHYVGDAF